MNGMDIALSAIQESLAANDVSIAKLEDDASFVSLGLDSLRLSEIVLEIESRLGVEFSEATLAQLNEARTIADLKAVITAVVTAREAS